MMGFRLCMLDNTDLNGWYRDPYLLAVWRESGSKDSVRGPGVHGLRDWRSLDDPAKERDADTLH